VCVKGLDQLRQAELYCSSCKDRNVLNLKLIGSMIKTKSMTQVLGNGNDCQGNIDILQDRLRSEQKNRLTSTFT